MFSFVCLRSTINGKNQAAEVRTSSLPVTQLLGKRSDKKACIAKRINSVAPTSNQVHNMTITEGSVYVAGKGGKPDSSGHSSKHHCGHQSKLQNEKICSIRLGATNDLESKNENMDITKNNARTEVKHKHTGSRSGKLIIPTKKSKFAPKEGSGDCTHRQVKTRRDLLARMTSVCKDSDIMDITSNTNHLTNLGTLSDKEKSKPSQFLTEKSSSDCDPLTQPMVPDNSGSAELTGKMDDDYEELIRAIEDANNARSLACSTPFWKEMEPYFRIVTQDDLDDLKKQVKFACNEIQGHPSQNFSSHRKSLSIANVEDNDLSSFKNEGDMQATRLSPEIEGMWLEKTMPLSERLLSALIVVDENEQGTMIGNDNGHKNFNHTSEVSTHKNHCENYSVDKTFSRVEQEMAGLLQIDNSERLNSSNESTSLNGYINYPSGVYIHSDKSGVECDILEGSDIDISKADSGNLKERHIVGWQRYLFGLQSGHQTNRLPSGIATHEIEYQQMSLDDKIMLELNSIGLFPESVPDLDSEDGGEIEEELEKLKKELQEQVCKTEGQITHLEQAVSESWKLEERERERIAMNKLVLRASKRYLGPRGRGFRRRSTKMKVEQQANLDFVKRTLHRCKTFDETGRSCFNEDPLKQKFFREVSKETTRKSLENAIDGKSLLEGEKEKSFENKKMRTGMNDVKDGLQGFGSVKGRTKGKTKPNGRVAQLWMESNRLLGKSGELSKSATTLINIEEKTSNKIVKETNDFTMGDVPVITQDIECESFVIDLSHLELPSVDYLEKYDMYDNIENLELFFEDDALQDAAAEIPVEAVMTHQQNGN
ncbi:uncharacterized protein LOC131041776 [Cryptomeria japonica]|uniref:uncharacterized protein LOC131041776 n=1 Tax=Cryptomeria japonica TaxID=3369 RepID=UPI0027D9D7CC|nr:uncharacterized protein LOC131041776 [Cryptomeria japonica]